MNCRALFGAASSLSRTVSGTDSFPPGTGRNCSQRQDALMDETDKAEESKQSKASSDSSSDSESKGAKSSSSHTSRAPSLQDYSSWSGEWQEVHQHYSGSAN